MSDPDWYLLLEEAQKYWYNVFAVHFPEILYGAPTIMVTSDDKVYTFASAVFPIGAVEIRASRNGELLVPGAALIRATFGKGEGVSLAKTEQALKVDVTAEGDAKRLVAVVATERGEFTIELY